MALTRGIIFIAYDIYGLCKNIEPIFIHFAVILYELGIVSPISHLHNKKAIIIPFIINCQGYDHDKLKGNILTHTGNIPCPEMLYYY